MHTYPTPALTPIPSPAGGQSSATTKRSVRLLEPQGGPSHSPTSDRPSNTRAAPQVYDPPRLPKEGYEWVWFPAGYWAEREVVELPRQLRKAESDTTANSWPFKWRKRSGKGSSSGGLTQDSAHSPSQRTMPGENLPGTASPPPRPRQLAPLASPYLSEAAQVESLQHPDLYHRIDRTTSSESDSSLANMDVAAGKPKAPMSTPWLSEHAHLQSQAQPRRSYFPLPSASSDASTPAAAAAAQAPHTLSDKSSLSPRTMSGGRRVETLSLPSLRLKNPSSESFTWVGTGTGEPVPRSRAPSPLRSSFRDREDSGPGLQPIETQVEADNSRRSGSLDLDGAEPKPKPSFMKRLMFDTRPKAKKARLQPDGSRDSIAIIIEEARPQAKVPLPSQQPDLLAPSSRASSDTQVTQIFLGGDESKTPATPKPSRTRKLFGMGIGMGMGTGPRHRQTRASAPGSIKSASSSVRDLLLKIRTPSPERGGHFPPSDLYPGGEAMRVQTPPLSESTYERRLRSFFFDIEAPGKGKDNGGGGGDIAGRSHHAPHSAGQQQNGNRGLAPPAPSPLPPPIANSSGSTTRTSGSSETKSGSRSGSGSTTKRQHIPTTTAASSTSTNTDNKKQKQTQKKTEWWEVPVPLPDYEDMAPSAFAFDLPEHLPSSPMCPANKRHPSGGAGVCVYHGRRRRSPESGLDPSPGAVDLVPRG